jgi:ATP-dependent DNA helicase RecG
MPIPTETGSCPLLYPKIIPQNHGNLFQQVDNTIDLLLTKYMKAYISYEGLQRVERYLFPAAALREALLNAVVHKDYSIGNPVQISVYEDKIIFWNAGRLPDELSIELLQEKHPSIPYNPLVASAFFRAGYIEAWVRGIEKINNECKVTGVPAPEINYKFAGLMITFRARSGEHGGISPETTPKTREKTREKTRGEPSGKVSGKARTTQKTTQKNLSILRDVTL